MKAFVINGSPRKKWNTTQAIDKAGEALKDNGFEVERIDLYDYTFKGCTSCFECKLKDAKINGVCTMKTGLRPSCGSHGVHPKGVECPLRQDLPAVRGHWIVMLDLNKG